MPVSDLTDQVNVQINGQPIDTSRVTVNKDLNVKVAPFVGIGNESSGIFEGAPKYEIEIEHPDAPEYVGWSSLPAVGMVITMLPRRVGCPKRVYQMCKMTKQDRNTNNVDGETNIRSSFVALREIRF